MNLWELTPTPQFTAQPRLIRGRAGGHDKEDQDPIPTTPEERALGKAQAKRKYYEARKGVSKQELSRQDRLASILNYLSTASYGWPVTERQIMIRCSIPRTTCVNLMEYLRMQNKVCWFDFASGRGYWGKHEIPLSPI